MRNAFCFVVLMLGRQESFAVPPPDTRALAEKSAGQLQFFSTREFLHDRWDLREFPKDVVKEYRATLAPVFDSQHSVNSWVALLKHPNARVRTLALAALFAREDPKLLPHIASLLDDQAATFSRPPQILSAIYMPPKFDPKTLEPQSVGDVAAAMIGFYIDNAELHLNHRKPTAMDFKAYWDARKDRTHCASWYAVKMSRASQSTSPVDRARIGRIRAVRAQIDQLPAVDRAWVLLSLMERQGRDLLISDQELVMALQQLGRDRLLGLLRRQADTNDPDWIVPQKSGSYAYKLAVQFVLAHADQLLRPEDGPTLLDYEAAELASVHKGNSNPIQTAYWAIAAAQLQPAKAGAILREAFGRFQQKYQKGDRAELALALWRARGPAETAFLLDWFYQEEQGLGEVGFGRTSFLGSIPGVRAPDDRKLLAAIVRDNRFETLDWPSLRKLIEVLNGWTKAPVISRDDLDKASHPYGMSHFTIAWRQKALDEYPRETQTLLQTLATWRTAVRTSLPRWE